MKTAITTCLLFFCMTIVANDLIYVHTTTAGNTSGTRTTLDHTALNNNPSATIFVIHNYSPLFTFHDVPIGTYYDGTNWSIQNEDGVTPMGANLNFNVFIANGARVDGGIANGTSNYFKIDNTLVNNDPLGVIITSKYYNPYSVYNPLNYGFWFDGINWFMYTENGANHPTNASYYVMTTPRNGSQAFQHTATAANIHYNWTVIDHPLLNGNPNAGLIAQHNWGATGDPSNIEHDEVIGVWYDGDNWAIYNENDTVLMAENLKFNVYVGDPPLAIEDNGIETSISMYPNPAIDHINIVTNKEISSVEVFNVLGQSVLQFDEVLDGTPKIDVSKLQTGTYLTTITTESGTQTLQFIKTN